MTAHRRLRLRVPVRPARVRDWPLQWKILVPFAVLALAYGVTGAFVFAQGTAAEGRANLTARLRDTATLTSSTLEREQIRLVETTRLIARTQGVADAVSRGDAGAATRLAVPPAANAGHAVNVLTDTAGVALIEIRSGDGRPRIDTGTLWGGLPILRPWPAPAGSDELRSGFVARDEVEYLAVAAPIRLGPQAVGTVLVADRLDAIARRLESLTSASLAIGGTGDRFLAGAGLPRPPPHLPSAVQVERTVEKRRMSVLYMPVTLRGERVGVVAIGLPSASGLGALGREGWKIAFLVLAVLAGVFVAGVVVAGRISRPLEHLLESTRALERGDLGHRAALDRHDEIGELAVSFNRMAERLQVSYDELEQRVQARTRELAKTLGELDHTNTELARASEAKSAFLASMSHELRTPLSAILLAAEMVNDQAYRSLPEAKIRDLGGKILGSARHLLALIEDLLDLSRIEAGRLELRPERVHVDRILEEVTGAIRPIAEEKQISLDVPAAFGLEIEADPVRARQVLFNLLANAVKFTGPGGRVWVEVTSGKNAVTMAVCDSGIGIHRKDLRRIFEPFEQVSGDARVGAGLGLAISRRLAEAHGGRLTASSAVGKGSVFRLTLPGHASAAGPSPPGPVVDLGSERTTPDARILIVDDDPAISTLAADVLTSAGYGVRVARTPSEALARAARGRYDLVLLDLMLGSSDGLALLGDLRARPGTRDAPVLAFSANARPEDIERAERAGCSGYVVKPVGGRDLVARVRALLESDHSERRHNGHRGRARTDRRSAS